MCACACVMAVGGGAVDLQSVPCACVCVWGGGGKGVESVDPLHYVCPCVPCGTTTMEKPKPKKNKNPTNRKGARCGGRDSGWEWGRELYHQCVFGGTISVCGGRGGGVYSVRQPKHT